MRLYFLFVIFLAGVSEGKVAENGTQICAAYSKLENEIHCGPGGYLIKYGKKYCIRFNSPEYKNRFDKAGQKFVDCTTDCLVVSITNITHNEEKKHPADCTDLAYQAFDSHVNCYLNCDFCKICKTNKAALLEAYDIKDFLSRAAIAQIYHVMKQCGIAVCF